LSRLIGGSSVYTGNQCNGEFGRCRAMSSQQVNMMTNSEVMAGLLESSYLEIVPLPGIAERLMQLPDQAYVAITCSPTKGVDATLDLVDALAKRHLRLVPHIAARMVRDRQHLDDVLQRLRQAGIESVFVPGGDAPSPLGRYSGSLDLLRAMAETGHAFKHIGVAAHPEGHPLISERQLLQLLLEKQAYANYLVTQMCFDPLVLIRWLIKMREAGVTLPAWIGLPGVADRARLFKLSTRIGVGQSARILLKQKGLLRRMLGIRPYRPDELLKGLLPHLSDSGMGIPGFHLFSFNDIERTEQWRREALAHYRRKA